MVNAIAGRGCGARVRALLSILLSLLLGSTYAGPMDMGGQFSISESGAATYSIPIAVPPGTAGIEPKLALSYNSQAGNGLLGVGWSLSGLSAITRCPRTMAQDGVRGAVNLDANDRFCLDGQRLVLVSGTYGAAGSEYRTERDGFSKIVANGGTTGDPTWFKVWSKSGQILEFGNTADSRIEAQGKTNARLWALNKISDTKGNYEKISYTENNANGEFYPSRIDYTGNAGTGLTPNNSVQFVYESRPDSVPQYFVGSLIKNSQRLSKIVTTASVGAVAEVRLGYDGAVSATSVVKTLTACTAQGVCLPAINLTWLTEATGLDVVFNEAPPQNPYSFSSGSVQMGDVNGDGKTDLIQITATAGKVISWLSNGDGTFTAVSYVSTVDTCMLSCGTWQAGDINGDGKTDLIHTTTNAGNVISWLSKGDGTFSVVSYTSAQDTLGSQGTYWYTGDFNGDGRTDLAHIAPGSLETYVNYIDQASIWLSNGDGTFITATPGLFGAYVPGPYLTGDINGDGKTDLIHITETAGNVISWLSNGDGTFTAVSYVSTTDTCMHSCGTWQAGDVNGDGKTDLIHIQITPSAGNVISWLSKGDGTFSVVSYTSTQDTSCYLVGLNGYSGPYLYTGDVNGDGKTDVVHVAPDSVMIYDLYLADQTNIWLSNGDGTFRVVILDTSTATFGGGLRLIGDVNGDGKSDVVHLTDPRFFVSLSKSTIPDKVTSIISGLGAQTQLSYAPLINNAVYTKGGGSVYPVVDLQAPLHVVSQAKGSNGVGGVRTSSYTYGGLKAEAGTGRGLLGFAWMQATDADTGVSVKTEYRQDWPYTGLPGKVTTTQSTAAGPNKQLNVVSNTYGCLNPTNGAACTVAAGNRYFPYLSQSVDSRWDLNGATLPTTTTTNSFDTYGNATSVGVSSNDGYSKTTTSTYNNDTTNWFLGRLLKSQVQSITP